MNKSAFAEECLRLRPLPLPPLSLLVRARKRRASDVTRRGGFRLNLAVQNQINRYLRLLNSIYQYRVSSVNLEVTPEAPTIDTVTAKIGNRMKSLLIPNYFTKKRFK
ncbi:hypothetical protein TNCV_1301881 [Trichonephila clavipes]|nr:hypothetical protein TNCV_1301881 [Trichonephila clavipes]